MPHHKSAVKRVRTNEKRRQRNVAGRSRLRHAVRTFRATTKPEEADALLREAISREVDVAFDGAFGFAGERCDRIVAGVLAKIAARLHPKA